MFNLFKRRNMDSIKQACCDYAAHLGAIAAQGYHDAGEAFAGRIVFDEAKWITVHPNGKGYNNNGEKIKGTPILIDSESGAVLGGAGGKFTGKHISEMPKRGANAIQAQHDIARAQQKNADPEGFAKRQKELIAKRDQQVQLIQAAAIQKKAEAERMAKEAQEKQVKEQAAAQERVKEQTTAQTAKRPTTRRRVKQASVNSSSQILAKYGAVDYQSITKDFDISGVSDRSALSVAKPFKAERDPVHYGYWEQQQEENRALCDPNWAPKIKFDLAEDKALQAGYNKLAKEAYAARAMKRIAIEHGQTIPPETLKRFDQLEADYNQALADISKRRAKQMATKLADMGQKIGVDALRKAGRNTEFVGRQILKDYDAEDIPPSLLRYIGYKSSAIDQVPKAAELDNARLYFKAPASVAALTRSDGRSKNIVFNNLFNAKFLLEAAQYAQDLSQDDRVALEKNYQDALTMYRESHDNLPLASCLNRDMGLIRQHGYGTAELTPDAVGDAPKGEPMSYKEADEGKGNPDYDAGVTLKAFGEEFNPFGVNCQSCVVANELRRRGYRVVAKPNCRNDDTNGYDLSYHTNLIWRNPITGAAPDMIPVDMYNYKNLGSTCAEGERYHLVITSHGSGHIVEFERINGKIQVLDPQTGFCGSVEEFFAQKNQKDKNDTMLDLVKSLYYYRVDNCEIYGSYANGVVKKAPE